MKELQTATMQPGPPRCDFLPIRLGIARPGNSFFFFQTRKSVGSKLESLKTGSQLKTPLKSPRKTGTKLDPTDCRCISYLDEEQALLFRDSVEKTPDSQDIVVGKKHKDWLVVLNIFYVHPYLGK